MLWSFAKRLPLIIGLGIVGFVMSSCTMLGLNYASLETGNKPEARPAIETADWDSWEARRTALKALFETHVYGPWPEGLEVSFGETRTIDGALGSLGVLEETPITLGSGESAVTFYLAVAYPAIARTTPVPVMIGQTFSSTCSVFPGAALTLPDGGLCDRDPMGGSVGVVARYIFGEFIAEAPIEQYFRQGLAYASFYASEVVPDSAGAAERVMQGLKTPDGVSPTGALMAWGYGFKAAVDLLEGDPRIDDSRIAVFGHSRHGKSALLAGVWDRRIDAVVAHQSGYGGAASSRSTAGEGLKRMTRGGNMTPVGPYISGYPHWFDPAYADYAGRLDEIPVDQHQLLALLAPTPVFLGNGRRDVWSDPNSTYRMAEAADAVYELAGSDGLSQRGMQDYNPSAGLSYFLRPGGHGTDQRDIDAIMAFLDAHFDLPVSPGGSASQAAER